jgi:hypothetical protein
MKFKATKAEVESLPEAIRGEYEEREGSFFLKLEGHEEAFVPAEKKNIAEQHRKEAEKKLAEANAREADLIAKLEKADGKKEVEAIRQQHQAEILKIKEAADKEREAIKGREHQALIETEAAKFAGEKFLVPSAISRLYKDRLSVEEVDGQPVIRVREPDGKPSVKSLSDLQKEFLENPEFKPIIKASQASGGGAIPGQKGGGSAQKTVQRSEFDSMDQTARMEFSKAGGKVVD